MTAPTAATVVVTATHARHAHTRTRVARTQYTTRGTRAHAHCAHAHTQTRARTHTHTRTPAHTHCACSTSTVQHAAAVVKQQQYMELARSMDDASLQRDVNVRHKSNKYTQTNIQRPQAHTHTHRNRPTHTHTHTHMAHAQAHTRTHSETWNTHTQHRNAIHEHTLVLIILIMTSKTTSDTPDTHTNTHTASKEESDSVHTHHGQTQTWSSSVYLCCSHLLQYVHTHIPVLITASKTTPATVPNETKDDSSNRKQIQSVSCDTTVCPGTTTATIRLRLHHKQQTQLLVCPGCRCCFVGRCRCVKEGTGTFNGGRSLSVCKRRNWHVQWRTLVCKGTSM